MINTLTFTAREQDAMLKTVVELAARGVQFTFCGAGPKDLGYEWKVSYQCAQEPQREAA